MKAFSDRKWRCLGRFPGKAPSAIPLKLWMPAVRCYSTDGELDRSETLQKRNKWFDWALSYHRNQLKLATARSALDPLDLSSAQWRVHEPLASRFGKGMSIMEAPMTHSLAGYPSHRGHYGSGELSR